MESYEELDLIGKGTYGKCFKVRSRADDEVYVVKKVQFDGTPQSEAEAAMREGQVLSLLRHPHVVPYKEFFKHTDGDLCLVMAYCEGGDLFKYIRALRKQGQTIPEPQVWEWLVQLLLSLSYIHAKRILHRDVKTQNIFLSGGKVLLGDFGLAKQLQRTFEMARTPIGTPYYMAPEIYEEQPYSFKSDVWALGCVAYEMLAGKAAFQADNLSRVVLRVIRGAYDPLPESYSPALRAVVGAMLCRDVAARPDANSLLTRPEVVPHVQSYLERLTAEGPAGWATWRMKLPPLALVAQVGEVLEAAGVPLTGPGGRRSGPPSARPSQSGTGTGASNGAAAGTEPGEAQLPRPQSARALLERERERVAQVAAEPSFSPETAPPATPAPRPPSAGGGGQVVKLPPLPLPGARLPPLRTPYGLATPFMAAPGAVSPAAAVPPAGPYAELAVLTHQIIAIRSSQCGEGEGEGGGSTLSSPPGRGPAPGLASAVAPLPPIGAGAGSRPGSSSSGIGGDGGGRPTSGGAASPRGPGSRPGSRLGSPNEAVRALDRTLVRTLELACKAAEEAPAPAAPASPGPRSPGPIDEAWLSAGLPQGGFGFGPGFGAPQPPQHANGRGLGHGQEHAKAAGASPLLRPLANGSQPATPSAYAPAGAAAAARQPFGRAGPLALAGDMGGGGGGPEPGEPYRVPDEGFLSLSQISLHAQSLAARRANLVAHCAERLGDAALTEEVMRAVSDAAALSRPDAPLAAVEAAEAALVGRLAALLAGAGRPAGLAEELRPVVEELAALAC